MSGRTKNIAFTLTETLVVVAIVALLLSVGIPAAKKLSESMESTDGVRNVVNAALCNARAIAIKEQKYAGVRFQFGQDGRQYMVVVVYDRAVGPEFAGNIGLRAVKRRKPNALPKSVGVMDLMVKINYPSLVNSVAGVQANEQQVVDDAWIAPTATDDRMFVDATTFTILFSPAGKLVHHTLRVSYNPDNNLSRDVFYIAASDSLLTHDDSWVIDGYQTEFSRKWFVIYNVETLAKVSPTVRWTGYLSTLERVFVNPHSGEIINR